MSSIKIDTIEKLHKILEEFRTKSHYKYRGQSDSSWNLIPKAGRNNFNSVEDESIYRHWKRRAIGILDKKHENEIDYLSIAQHTGLPTRLLDWSHSPLIALFFTVIDNLKKDGALFMYSLTKEEVLKFEDINNFNPFDKKLEKNYFFHLPTSTINRLDNQFGHFSIHKKPQIPFEEICIKDRLRKYIIPKEIKKDILLLLNHYGINYLTIYPDLEGLSKHLSWYYENNNLWKE